MGIIKFVQRKSMKIRPSGRSSDFITPSFGFGCLYKCAYCYMRRHAPNGLTVANNPETIIRAIYKHEEKLGKKKPNQTHDKYWTYDISCNEDFALHVKHHDWKFIFDAFKYHNRIMATFATKHVNKTLLNYNPSGKIRIRFSLMPQEYSTILEPNTSKIIERIEAVNDFIEAGYDVHLNFSPVIEAVDAIEKYTVLFQKVDKIIKQEHKSKVKAEVIFLTHNQKMHELNLKENPLAETLLWKPGLQEEKTTSYGQKGVLRYKRMIKGMMIHKFKELHNSIIPWNTIRYIF